MAVSRESMQEHKQKYGVLYMVTVIGSLLPMLTMGGYILRSFDGLSTDLERQTAIASHITAGMHPAGERAIEEVAAKSECRWLDDKIDRLDDLIYQLQRDGASADRIHDKEKALRKYKNKYQAKNCASLNYS